MHSRIPFLSALLLISGCSGRTVDEAGDELAAESDEASETQSEASETQSEASETQSEASETQSDTTGIDAEACSCVTPELVCDDALRPTALHECDVAHPCGVVDIDLPDAEVAACVLQLLVDQDTPSRFDYLDSNTGGWGNGYYVGTFYILGTGTGIDLACEQPSYDIGPPPPVATVAYHAINEPAYFADCLDESATVMTGCIFNGLSLGELVAECG